MLATALMPTTAGMPTIARIPVTVGSKKKEYQQQFGVGTPEKAGNARTAGIPLRVGTLITVQATGEWVSQ
jgi:hypothetical protein